MKVQQKQLLESVARAPVLLVACDFDGVLAPIVATPDAARLEPAAGAALRALDLLERTHAAVVSGRGLEELAALTRELGPVRRVGSHGAERNGARPPVLREDEAVALARVRVAWELVARGFPGALVECKPLSVAFHYRRCEAGSHAELLHAVNAAAGHEPGLIRREGLMVVELCATPADKGAALLALRQQLGATAVVYVGDDATDEHAFSVLQPGDLGIKVGPGETRAVARLDDQSEVVALLASLVEMRGAWLSASAAVPIERHALLSDQRTSALVDPRGRVCWMCLPRADSASIFAELLGGASKGGFSIEPEVPAEPTGQAYVDDSFVLRTTWPTMTVTDYLDCAGGRPYQRAGRSDLLRVIEGSGTARVRFAPRLDFGRLATELTPVAGGLVVESPSDPLVLVAPGLSWTIEQDGPHQSATASVDLSAGPVVLELRSGFGGLQSLRLSESDRRSQTLRFWSGWARTLELPAVAPDLVKRSALALKALVFGPTGAIFAAATTSLPEHLGGVRNWDYRYCWPRDACLAAASLIRLGNTGVAMKLLDWLVGVVASCESPERLRPLYTVTGADLGPEGEIGDLTGYADSRPVRIGNAADHQVQLDVFGPIVDLVAMLVERGASVTPEHWRLVEAMVGAVASRWQEPDHGIWEVRGPRRHHTHTKAMCWMAVDRAIFIAREVLSKRRPEWEALANAIRQDILLQGWSHRAGAFTFDYGSEELDAAALAVGLCGVVAPDDPRFRATVDAVERGLLEPPVVLRYRLDDGLPGIEGGFHICTSWLVESLAMVGETSRARELFEGMIACAGPLGLLSEQHDARTGRALGNFPQAYSHLGVINAATRLSARGPE